MVYFFKRVSVDYQDETVTELERSERHPGILDLALDAGTNGTLRIPFWGGESIFICMTKSCLFLHKSCTFQTLLYLRLT